MVKNQNQSGSGELEIGLTDFPAKPMTVAGLAEWINVSRRFLEGEINAGRLRARKISKRCVRIMPSDVKSWLDQAATLEAAQ
jgi:excisionase family DNA binding protein